MINLTFEQVFGKGAVQDNTTITIPKSSLLGLTPLPSNKAEQLLVSIILQIQQHFEGFITDDTGQVLTDHLRQPISYSNEGLYEKLTLLFWKRQFFRNEKPYITDRFVVSFFVKPPTEYGVQPQPDNLVY